MKVSDCKIMEGTSCKEDMNIVQVAKKLKNEVSKHLIAVDKNKKPTGIISSVDIVNKIVASAKDPKKAKAKDIMTKDIFSADIEEELSKVYYGLVKRNIYFCPITKQGKLYGIITLQEITKNICISPR